MTPLETIAIVERHLLNQAKKAVVNGTCYYRTPDGLKCAAGCLIPDDEYSPTMEGNALFGNPAVIAVMNRHGHDIIVVRSLQWIHDNHEPSEWQPLIDSLKNDYQGR